MSEQSPGAWIPIKERLPVAVGRDYWTTIKTWQGLSEGSAYYDGRGVWCIGDGESGEVVAWLEIEPWKEIKMTEKTIDGDRWIFTFGFGQGHDNGYCIVHGSYEEARAKMFKAHPRWGFQYANEDEAGVAKFKLKLVDEIR